MELRDCGTLKLPVKGKVRRFALQLGNRKLKKSTRSVQSILRNLWKIVSTNYWKTRRKPSIVARVETQLMFVLMQLTL